MRAELGARRPDPGGARAGCAAASTRPGSTRSRPRCSPQQLAGGDLADPAAPVRRRGRRSRPHRGGRPLGDRPGAVHRPAGGRDAGRRRAARRAARPGFVGGLLADPAAATLLGCAGGAAARRLRRDPAPEQGGGAMTAVARRARGAARLRRRLGARRRRRASGSARSPRRALARLSGGRAGFAGRARRAARAAGADRARRARRRLDPRAVVAAKLAGAVAGAADRRCRRPRSLGARLGSRRLAGLVVAGFLAPDALLERAAQRAPAALRRRRFPTRSTCSPSAPPSGRDPASGLAAIAATGAAGPLTAELGASRRRGRVRHARCARRSTRCAGAFPGPRSGALAAALERSRTYGSPLAEQLHLQATGAAPRGAAADRGPRGARGAEDPARRRARPRALGAADARRRDRRPLGRAARPVLSPRG